MHDVEHPVRKMGVTLRQKLVLEFVTKYCAEHGYSPSYQEIGEAVGISSKSGVKRLVDALVDRGRLETMPRRARSLVVVGSPA
jgi:repressor LexA